MHNGTSLRLPAQQLIEVYVIYTDLVLNIRSVANSKRRDVPCIPTTLVCLLFSTAIPTSLFNHRVFFILV